MIVELSNLLSALKVSADWVGLRATQESSTHRTVRDGIPEYNRTTTTQGIMVEVLVKGQIGYAATNLLTLESVQTAALDGAAPSDRRKRVEYSPNAALCPPQSRRKLHIADSQAV